MLLPLNAFTSSPQTDTIALSTRGSILQLLNTDEHFNAFLQMDRNDLSLTERNEFLSIIQDDFILTPHPSIQDRIQLSFKEENLFPNQRADKIIALVNLIPPYSQTFVLCLNIYQDLIYGWDHLEEECQFFYDTDQTPASFVVFLAIIYWCQSNYTHPISWPLLLKCHTIALESSHEEHRLMMAFCGKELVEQPGVASLQKILNEPDLLDQFIAQGKDSPDLNHWYLDLCQTLHEWEDTLPYCFEKWNPAIIQKIWLDIFPKKEYTPTIFTTVMSIFDYVPESRFAAIGNFLLDKWIKQQAKADLDEWNITCLWQIDFRLLAFAEDQLIEKAFDLLFSSQFIKNNFLYIMNECLGFSERLDVLKNIPKSSFIYRKLKNITVRIIDPALLKLSLHWPQLPEHSTQRMLSQTTLQGWPYYPSTILWRQGHYLHSSNKNIFANTQNGLELWSIAWKGIFQCIHKQIEEDAFGFNENPRLTSNVDNLLVWCLDIILPILYSSRKNSHELALFTKELFTLILNKWYISPDLFNSVIQPNIAKPEYAMMFDLPIRYGMFSEDMEQAEPWDSKIKIQYVNEMIKKISHHALSPQIDFLINCFLSISAITQLYLVPAKLTSNFFTTYLSKHDIKIENTIDLARDMGTSTPSLSFGDALKSFFDSNHYQTALQASHLTTSWISSLFKNPEKKHPFFDFIRLIHSAKNAQSGLHTYGDGASHRVETAEYAEFHSLARQVSQAITQILLLEEHDYSKWVPLIYSVEKINKKSSIFLEHLKECLKGKLLALKILRDGFFAILGWKAKIEFYLPPLPHALPLRDLAVELAPFFFDFFDKRFDTLSNARYPFDHPTMGAHFQVEYLMAKYNFGLISTKPSMGMYDSVIRVTNISSLVAKDLPVLKLMVALAAHLDQNIDSKLGSLIIQWVRAHPKYISFFDELKIKLRGQNNLDAYVTEAGLPSDLIYEKSANKNTQAVKLVQMLGNYSVQNGSHKKWKKLITFCDSFLDDYPDSELLRKRRKLSSRRPNESLEEIKATVEFIVTSSTENAEIFRSRESKRVNEGRSYHEVWKKYYLNALHKKMPLEWIRMPPDEAHVFPESLKIQIHYFKPDLIHQLLIDLAVLKS